MVRALSSETIAAEVHPDSAARMSYTGFGSCPIPDQLTQLHHDLVGRRLLPARVFIESFSVFSRVRATSRSEV